MKYQVKPEYIDLWFIDDASENVITEEELLRLSREWEKPVNELLEQLIEIEN